MVAIVERTQIYLTEQQQRELERRVISSGRTKSDLIREALDAFLGLQLSKDEWQRRWREAVDAISGIAPYLPEGDAYAQQLRDADIQRKEELERRRRE
jgi:Arc/MetJ-type ribon-helix-helix transcriptional regulator